MECITRPHERVHGVLRTGVEIVAGRIGSAVVSGRKWARDGTASTLLAATAVSSMDRRLVVDLDVLHL